MKIKKQHRLLSLVFSLALVISALGTGVPTSAENTAIDPITKVNMNLWSTITLTDYVGTAGNNLKDQFCDVRFVENNQLTNVKSNYSDWLAGFLFDSNVTNRDVSLTADGTTLTADSSANQTANYWQLLFKFDGVLNNPKHFVFGFHKTNNNFKASHYAVFASEKYEDLENSKIIDINDADGRKGDLINIDGLNLNNIGYVDIRIYNTGSENWTQHITELVILGGTVVSDNVSTDHTALSKNPNVNLSGNRLAGSEIKGGFYSGDKLIKDCGLDASDALAFFDGVLSDNYSTGWNVGKKYTVGYSNDIFQTENYYQIQIELSGRLKSPDRFVLIGRKDGNFMSKHYAVFASDDLNNLYSSDNKIIEIFDSTERAGDEIDLSGFDKTVNYVGIRFYHRGYTFDAEQGNTLQFINEIGLYGGELVKDPDTSTKHTVLTSKDQVNLPAENLLADKTVSGGFYADNSKTSECTNI